MGKGSLEFMAQRRAEMADAKERAKKLGLNQMPPEREGLTLPEAEGTIAGSQSGTGPKPPTKRIGDKRERPLQKSKTEKLAEAKQAVEAVTTQTKVTTRVTTRKRGTPENHTPSTKVANWRKDNKDHYNEYMRNYRAKKKANAAP